MLDNDEHYRVESTTIAETGKKNAGVCIPALNMMSNDSSLRFLTHLLDAVTALTRRTMESFYRLAAGLDIWGMRLLRIGLFIVLVWIGGLKFVDYEADGIVPLIANSPMMSFLYTHSAPEYKLHTSPEGRVSSENHDWEKSNRTYQISYALGTVIVTIGVLIIIAPVAPGISCMGSLLLVCMSFTTLSFLVTTPEAWVQPLGSAAHGFPYLSIAGRLIVKDCIMLGAAVVTMADSAKRVLASKYASA